MAKYSGVDFCILLPFQTSRHVGYGDAIFSYNNDPHPAAKGEHYARNAQIHYGVATWGKGIEWSDPRIRDAALDRTVVWS